MYENSSGMIKRCMFEQSEVPKAVEAAIKNYINILNGTDKTNEISFIIDKDETKQACIYVAYDATLENTMSDLVRKIPVGQLKIFYKNERRSMEEGQALYEAQMAIAFFSHLEKFIYMPVNEIDAHLKYDYVGFNYIPKEVLQGEPMYLNVDSDFIKNLVQNDKAESVGYWFDTDIKATNLECPQYSVPCVFDGKSTKPLETIKLCYTDGYNDRIHSYYIGDMGGIYNCGGLGMSKDPLYVVAENSDKNYWMESGEIESVEQDERDDLC